MTVAHLRPDREGVLKLSDVGYTGDRLRALREGADPQSVLPDFLPPEFGLIGVLGRNQSGKTSLVTHLGLTHATGESPWGGAPSLPPGRTLLISNEQTTRQVDMVARRLANEVREGDGWAYGRFVGWEDNLVIVGKENREAQAIRRLDERGLEALTGALTYARDVEDWPFRVAILDSVSRLKPLNISENDPDELGRWLVPLGQLAIDLQLIIYLVHHSGHEARSDARGAARGASSFGDQTQAQWLVTRDGPCHRRVNVDGNFVLERTFRFRVCEDENPGRIDFWRLEDAAAEPVRETEAIDLRIFMTVGETLTCNGLAWRLRGVDPIPGERPGGRFNARAAKAIEHAVAQSWAMRAHDGKVTRVA